MDFEIKKQLEAARRILEDLRESLDFAGREAQIAELEEIVAQPGFWDKPDEAQQIMQKITGLRSKMEQFNTVQTLVEDAETLYEMFKEMGDDEDLLKETGEAADKATEALEKMGLPATIRGEALTLEQFGELSNLLKALTSFPCYDRLKIYKN